MRTHLQRRAYPLVEEKCVKRRTRDPNGLKSLDLDRMLDSDAFIANRS